MGAFWQLRGGSQLPEVVVAQVKRGTLTTPYSAEGVVKGWQATLSPLALALVSEVLVREGESVRAGQLLMHFWEQDLLNNIQAAAARRQAALNALREAQRTYQQARAQVYAQIKRAETLVKEAEAQLRLVQSGARSEEIEQARQEVEAAQSAYDLAQRDAERAERLYQQGALPRAALERAQQAQRAAQARLRAAQARLRQLQRGARPEELEAAHARVETACAELQLARTQQESLKALQERVQIARAALQEADAALQGARRARELRTLTAPRDCIVVRIHAEPGESVAPSMPVIELTDPQSLWIEAELAQEDAAKANAGDTVQVCAPALPRRRWAGRIESILPAMERKPDSPLSVRILRAIVKLNQSKFADYQGLRPRQRLTIRWRDEKAELAIAGIVRSPEYVYVVQSKQDLLPSEDVFGVLFAPRELVGQLTGQSGRINEVRVWVAEGYNPELIAREVKRLLAAYDPEPPVMRKDQPSYYLRQSAVNELRSYAVFFPALFLSVSVLTLYALLMRLVAQQRHTIGLLRALGYTRAQVLMHYLSGALLTGLIGGLVGVPAAFIVSYFFSEAYLSFLGLPVVVNVPPWTQTGVSMLLALGATLLSGAVPAWQAAQIPPAQALRPESPIVGRVASLDRFIPLLNRARLLYRLPVRNLSRSPWRTIVGVLGVGLGVMMAMLARGIMDSRDVALALYFEQVLSEDLRVGFAQLREASVVNQVRTWRGVERVEGSLELPVKLRRGERTYDALLRAVDPNSPQRRLFTEAGEPVALTGLVCGQVVQDRLGLERGDMVYLSLPAELLDEPPRETPVRVHGLVWETIGTVVYMPHDQAQAWLRRQVQAPPNAISSLRVWVQPAYQREVMQRLKQLPGAGR